MKWNINGTNRSALSWFYLHKVSGFLVCSNWLEVCDARESFLRSVLVGLTTPQTYKVKDPSKRCQKNWINAQNMVQPFWDWKTDDKIWMQPMVGILTLIFLSKKSGQEFQMMFNNFSWIWCFVAGSSFLRIELANQGESFAYAVNGQNDIAKPLHCYL